ncbi:unnamed protein product [Arctogadus glacialis]
MTMRMRRRALLEGEFPKLKTLKGGWMFYKATGGSGRRKLSIIPTESEGYSTRLLKSASNNGKNTMFIVPLQEQLSTEPLPYDSAEFAKMPQSSCITCGSQRPLQLLPLHVEGCNGTLIESECETPLDDSPIIEQPVSPTTWNGESSELKNTELTAAETTRVTDLCLSWDLPVPTSTNHDWLFQELLSHAVIHRVRLPIKQIRKGLKETGIWPLLSSRPDVGPIIFPRESNEELKPQAVIQNIHWPQPKSDSDEEEDDPVPLEKVSLITGFLRKFIEEASPEVLRDLMRFWVGWELPAKKLFVEVATSTYPTAFTCFYKLKLPGHYQTYLIFHQEMMMAISSVSSGFGLV